MIRSPEICVTVCEKFEILTEGGELSTLLRAELRLVERGRAIELEVKDSTMVAYAETPPRYQVISPVLPVVSHPSSGLVEDSALFAEKPGTSQRVMSRKRHDKA